MTEATGRIVRSEHQVWFLPENLVEQLVARAVVSPVPGSPLLMALIDGEVLPVLPLGRLEAFLIICVVDGERLALGGLQVAASGAFEQLDAGAHVRFEDRSVPYLDLKHPLHLLASLASHSTSPREEAR